MGFMSNNFQVRTPAEQKKQLKGLVQKDKLRRAKLKASGIDFYFPDIVSGSILVILTRLPRVCSVQIDVEQEPMYLYYGNLCELLFDCSIVK